MKTLLPASFEKYSLDTYQENFLARVYRESEIYLLTAEYSDAQISGLFRWFTPTCYKKEPTHLTRIQIVSYIGQISYLFGVLLARDGIVPLSEQQYIERVEADKATFLELKLRFRHFIKPTPEVKVALACRRTASGAPVLKRLRGVLVMPFLIDIANGACVGESEAVVVL